MSLNVVLFCCVMCIWKETMEMVDFFGFEEP